MTLSAWIPIWSARPHRVRITGWNPIRNAPRPAISALVQRALASVTSGQVDAFHAASRARVEAAIAARMRPGRSTP